MSEHIEKREDAESWVDAALSREELSEDDKSKLVGEMLRLGRSDEIKAMDGLVDKLRAAGYEFVQVPGSNPPEYRVEKIER